MTKIEWSIAYCDLCKKRIDINTDQLRVLVKDKKHAKVYNTCEKCYQEDKKKRGNYKVTKAEEINKLNKWYACKRDLLQENHDLDITTKQVMFDEIAKTWQIKTYLIFKGNNLKY